MRKFALLLIVTLGLTGCPATQPPGGIAMTQPTTGVDIYNTVNSVAQGAEGVANVLAGAGLIPQIDVNLAIAAVNEALLAWHNALNPPIGAAASPVAVVKTESNVHKKLAALETLIAEAKEQQALRMGH